MIGIPKIGISIGRRSGSAKPLYDKILVTQAANLLAYLPLNDISGTVATNYAPARSGVNILKNPSFNNTVSTFNGWGNNGAGTRQLVTDDVHSAGSAAKITSSGAIASINQVITVIPGNTYTVNLWNHGDSTNALTVQVLRGDQGAYMINESTGVTGTTYTEYSKTFVAPQGYTTAIFKLLKTAPAGSVWIDDVRLYSNNADAVIFNGVIANNPTLNQDGLSGKSILFSGTEVIQINNAAYANSVPVAGSFVIFGKPTLESLTDGVARWMFKLKTHNTGTPNYIDVFKDANNNKVGWQFNSNTGEAIYRITDWSTADWFSLGMTWSSNGLKLYLNGVQVVNTIASTPVWTTVFDFTTMAIGAEYSDAHGTGNWKGNLQHFGFWDKELTADEMLYVGKK